MITLTLVAVFLDLELVVLLLVLLADDLLDPEVLDLDVEVVREELVEPEVLEDVVVLPDELEEEEVVLVLFRCLGARVK